MTEPAIHQILREALKHGASDVHLLCGSPPAFRTDGAIALSPAPPLTREQIQDMIDGLLTEAQQSHYWNERSLCFSRHITGLGYFRFSLAFQLGRPEVSIRMVMSRVPTLDELGLPPILAELLRRPSGLVLITGPTGVGKTTSLNALIGRINAEARKKVITIEDPVEFVHERGRSLVVQREIGSDSPSFSAAVIGALRQDPDIICIGEMRDLETITSALTAAETGHLVLATLHTAGAVGTISRIIDVFPAAQQNQVRVQLASTLEAILTQKLLPRADGNGRLLVFELLLVNLATRNLIRDGRANQIANIIQTGRAQGMCSMDQMIREAYQAGEITWDVATSAVSDPSGLRRSR